MLDLLLSFIVASVSLYWVFVPIFVLGVFALVSRILIRSYN